ncbi:hypothetical protein THAOC_29929 [Thalassiosira oceanica]|uniref:Uncharacterized protein n=1 Tax=Thalassiosira oceanica TaxID=159749 RepID=K0RW36_THAOC|nr:hypothetical protein THAOC_29929 [Thalassiosira oceanica]|eukprot:EJK50957.1 hypothetical protein THAOC_29929 [Thalassiosira oceanica]
MHATAILVLALGTIVHTSAAFGSLHARSWRTSECQHRLANLTPSSRRDPRRNNAVVPRPGKLIQSANVPRPGKLFQSSSEASSTVLDDEKTTRNVLRAKLAELTGFSLTAFRATLRAATGLSLSGIITKTMRTVLEFMTPGMRYFLQPLLIIYYTPLVVMRYWVLGPSQNYVDESLSKHERVVSGWRRAVKAAEKAHEDGYWPVHVNDDGTVTTSLPPDPNEMELDLTDAIEMSVADELDHSS